jgi:hypothetical protein
LHDRVDIAAVQLSDVSLRTDPADEVTKKSAIDVAQIELSSPGSCDHHPSVCFELQVTSPAFARHDEILTHVSSFSDARVPSCHDGGATC